MRKEILRTLINQYIKEASNLESLEPFIKRLTNFMRSEAIQQLSDHADISFADFSNYLATTLHKEHPNESKQQINKRINDVWPKLSNKKGQQLMRRFIENRIISTTHHLFPILRTTAKPYTPSIMLPFDLTSHIIHKLKKNSLNNLAITSSLFYREINKPDYWKYKILKLGINRDTLDELIKENIIINFRKLYYTLFKLNYSKRKINKLTINELFMISHEKDALAYLKQKTSKKMEAWLLKDDENPLHIAARTGNIAVMEHCIQHLKMDPEMKSAKGLTILELAAANGHVKAMQYAVEQLKQKTWLRSTVSLPYPSYVASKLMEIDSLSLPHPFITWRTDWTPRGENVLHYAVKSRNIEAAQYAITLGYKIDSKTHLQETPLHFAALLGDVEMMRYLVRADATLDYITALGENILLLAARSGNIKAIGYAKKIADHHNKYEPSRPTISTTVDLLLGYRNFIDNISGKARKFLSQLNGLLSNAHVLHLAALSGNIEAIDYVANEFQKELTSTIKSQTFFWVVQSGNVAAVKHVVTKFNINPTRLHPLNNSSALHFAAYAGDLETIKYLIVEMKIDANILTQDLITPLDFAAAGGQVEAMAFFIEQHAANPLTNYVISRAHFSQNPDAVRYLRSKGNTHPLSRTSIPFIFNREMQQAINEPIPHDEPIPQKINGGKK